MSSVLIAQLKCQLIPPMNNRTKKHKLFAICSIAAAGMLLCQSGADAATIVWSGPQRITGDTDVKTSGTLLGAYSFSNGTSGSAVSTVNGVPFVVIPASATQGYLSSTGGYIYQGFNSTVSPYVNLSYNYRQILLRGLYGVSTLTFSGLTAGQTYMVQLWLNDSRGDNAAQTSVNLTVGTSPLNFVSPSVDAMATALVDGQVGQYMVGYLTMGPSETSATFTVSASVAGGARQVNAVQLRTASGPSAWMVEGKYGIMLHYLPGGALPDAQGSGMGYSENAQITAPATQSPWSAAVAEFDATAFANQVEQTGASWVILTTGQSNGYYTSWNDAYQDVGGLNPGEFTAQRDLIANVADALKPKGISVIAYMAAEGPTRATTMRRHDGQYIKIQELTYAVANPSATPAPTPWAPGAHPTLRDNINDMVAEWSARWGAKVAGWWFDGCFPGTGYGAAAENGDPVGNLNALIAAAKSGNPSSMVAVNPGYGVYSPLTSASDYLAGEWGAGNSKVWGSYQYDKLGVYPTGQFLSYGGKDVQWHTLSFLGKTWRNPIQRYVNEELISYVSAVNSMGGVVTLDVDYTRAGEIKKEHFDQLKALKAALKPNIAPIVPVEEPAKFLNLALYKPAYFKNNSPGNIDSPELRPLGPRIARANAGNDADLSTKAEAADDGITATPINAYSYIVDLRSSQSFDRIVFYQSDHYAVSYEIYYSADGSNWSYFNPAQTSYSVGDFERKVYDAGATRTGRYIKIKASAPDSYHVRMSIGELEVFNTGAVSTAKDTVWMDENVPGVAAPNKTVGTTLTTNGSGGSWKWAGTMDDDWSTYGNPHPQGGIRVHWSPVKAGHNEHGFTDSPALMKVASSGDSLYCWVWIDPAQPTQQILLRWRATDGTEGRARWGSVDLIPDGGTDMGSLPAAGEWVKLSVPANIVGMNGKTLKGMSFAVYDGKVVFDRAGKNSP